MLAGAALLGLGAVAVLWWQLEYIPARLAEASRQYAYAVGLEEGRQPRKAFIWYRHAADHGDVRAMMVVAHAYEEGSIHFTVMPQLQKAARYFLMAAEKGEPAAMGETGLLYEHGGGVPQDDKLALTWYRRGADLGDPLAIKSMIEVYKEGKFGLPKSAEDAHYWEERLAGTKPEPQPWARPYM
jgi:TPR repeat protein